VCRTIDRELCSFEELVDYCYEGKPFSLHGLEEKVQNPDESALKRGFGDIASNFGASSQSM
jgi:hypothetical protein